MSTRITDLPQAETLNGSEVMPLVQNGVTKKATLDFINLAAPAALILQQTQQVYQDTVDVKTATDAVLIETQSVLTDTQNVLGQTVTVRDQTEALKLDFETQYLGPHPSAPTLNNEGGPLEVGALYWDTTLMAMFVWDGATWTAFSSAVASVNGFIGEVVLNYTHVGAAGPGANTNITSLGGLTGDVATTTGVQFDTAAPSAGAVGKLTWNTADSTLDLGVSASSVLQIGQEVYYRVKNGTLNPIMDGSLVRLSGTEGNSGNLLVEMVVADGTHPSETFLGLTTEALAPGASGFATYFGKVRGVDTTGNSVGEVWADGDILYASTTLTGGLTKVEPEAPNNKVMVALVVHAHPNGVLFVRPSYGSNLGNDELVQLNTLADGDVLQYDAAQFRFENRSLNDAGIEPLGTAAASMASHLLDADPHPQYTTAAEASAVAPVQSVAGKTGAVSLTNADVGLGNVDNTSDADKPVSTATATALNLKFDKAGGSITGNTNIVVNSASEALRITQTGTGLALRVEDSANPDSTPFAVDADGNVGVKTAAPAVSFAVNASDAILVPIGSTANRPTGATGYFRFNTELTQFEGHNGTAWSRIFDQTNILGTVSQSGGVPTGAVVERGSNANGEYVRFADGTQICTRVFLASTLTNTAITLLNSQSGDYRTPQSTVSYAAVFSGQPSYAGVSWENQSSGWWATAFPLGPSGAEVNLRATNSVAAPSYLVANIYLVAIGRWF